MKSLKANIAVAVGLLIFATKAEAEVKVDRDVRYGMHERTVQDV